jgi:hypothetical protein
MRTRAGRNESPGSLNRMAEKDLCLEKIEGEWEISLKEKAFPVSAQILKELVKYLQICGEIPEDWNPVIKKRIGFLEKKLDSMNWKDAAAAITAIKYARKRLNTRDQRTEYGRHFGRNASVSDTERARVTRTLDSSFLASLTRSVVAFTDSLDDDDEPSGDDLDTGGPQLD